MTAGELVDVDPCPDDKFCSVPDSEADRAKRATKVAAWIKTQAEKRVKAMLETVANKRVRDSVELTATAACTVRVVVDEAGLTLGLTQASCKLETPSATMWRQCSVWVDVSVWVGGRGCVNVDIPFGILPDEYATLDTDEPDHPLL